MFGLFRWLWSFASSVTTSGSAESSRGALNEREQIQVARLLSDPTYFPIEFKRWLKDYLEGQDLKVLASNVHPEITTKWGTTSGLPIGAIFYAPDGHGMTDVISCDGNNADPVAYKALFDIIGFDYGSSGTDFLTPNIPPLTGFPGPDIKAWIVKGRDQ